MSQPGSLFLEARVVRKVHESLTVDLSLDLDCETGILFGPSGAGKTTALRLISGLARPDAGRVSVGGKTLFDSAAHIDEPLRNRQIGMIFQDDQLFPHLSVAANVEFGLKGWKPAARRDRLAEVTELCGIENLLRRMPATLSGGERQRVGLARALAPRPRLLLCDEPVSALDLANRHALLDKLRLVQQALSVPILYVTHSPSEAFALGSRLFLIKAGRIVATGVRSMSCPGVAMFPPARTPGKVSGTSSRPGLRNHDEANGASLVELDGGPVLTVPSLHRQPGAPYSSPSGPRISCSRWNLSPD